MIDSLEIHPAAAKSFDERASSLLGLIKEIPRLFSNDEFKSEIHVVATINENEMLGEPSEGQIDYRGSTVARYFYRDRCRYGIEDENYRTLVDLAAAIQSNRSVSSALSFAFIEESLFTWISMRFKGEDCPESFVAYLKELAAQRIRDFTVWVPISNLEIEFPFPIGNSELRPLSSKEISSWAERFAIKGHESEEGMLRAIDELRKRYQGLAAVRVEARAEEQRAFEIAEEEARKASALLGLVSVGMHFPDVRCMAMPKGCEEVRAFNAIAISGADKFVMNAQIRDRASMHPWRMGGEEISQARRLMIDRASALLKDTSSNKFKDSILASLFLYSKAAFTSEPVEKLVYILAGLESSLLKNENEPIQQNLGERLAVFLSEKLEDRKSIIRDTKAIYAVRSRFLHHGHHRADLQTVKNFMPHAWRFFVSLLMNADRFPTKENFLNAIDDRKLG